MLHIPGLYIIKDEKKGRCVHTSEDLREGDLIEICPIIKIRKGKLELIDKTIFYNYYFVWEEKGYDACIALGYGSLYNHSRNPNATVIMDYTDDTIRIEAATTILSGEEIVIDYTGGIKGGTELWFDPK